MDSNSRQIVKQDNSPVARLKNAINSESVQQQFKNALKENAGLFIASLIDVYASDHYLQKCAPKDVIMESLKAATLKLPINKGLGFAYIVPYKNKATMIIGYKGYLQLAQRTAQYRYINADAVYEGERVEIDRLTGECFFSGEPTSEKAIGYFAHIETITGFRKTVFWPRERIESHAKKYSQSYNSEYGPWRQHFDAMAIKTVLKHLLTKYGIMSVDMASAIDLDNDQYSDQPIQPKPVGASYDVTAQAPEAPKQKAAQVSEKNKTEPQAQETIGSPTELVQDPNLDELGMPHGHPFSKKEFYGKRAGSTKDKTGFNFHIEKHKEVISDITDEAYELMDLKHQKLYGEPLPDYVNEILGKTEETQEPEPDNEPDVELLNTEAAKRLAELASKHPKEYALVVAGQVPENLKQILDWTSDINQMVVDNAKGTQDGPPEQDGDPGPTENW